MDTSPGTAEVDSAYQLYGDPAAQIIACGHSHVRCLVQALNEGRGPADESAAVAFTRDGEPPERDDYWDYVAGLSVGRTLAVVWNGNQHNGDFLLQQRPPFRVWDPEGADQESEPGGWQPRAMFRALWRPTLDGLAALLDRVADTARTVVVMTPPPKPEAFVRAALATEPHFLAEAARLGYDMSDVEVTSESVRLALWRILRDLTAETAAAHGAAFVPVPSASTSADGLLLPAYSRNDVTHANAAYGALVWAQLTEREHSLRSPA